MRLLFCVVAVVVAAAVTHAHSAAQNQPQQLVESADASKTTSPSPSLAAAADVAAHTLNNVQSRQELKQQSKAAPPVYHVSANGDDSGGDGSQAKPWLTIKHAIDQSKAAHAESSTIVLEGTFSSSGDLNLDLSSVPSQQLIYNFTFTSLNSTQPAVVDCVGGSFITSLAFTALTMINIEIANCNSVLEGGAIHARTATTLTLRSMVFRNNQSPLSGGAVIFSGGQLEITDSHFFENEAKQCGGAVAIIDSAQNATRIISDSIFLNNTAGVGGALCLDQATNVTIGENVLVSGNVAPQGAAVSCTASSIEFISEPDFINNADSSGGGSEWACPSITSCTFIAPESVVGISPLLCNLAFPPILVDTSRASPDSAQAWNVTTERADPSGANATLMHTVEGEDGDMMEMLRYELIPYSTGVNVTLLFKSDLHPQLGPYVLRWSLSKLQLATTGAPDEKDLFPVTRTSFEWHPVARVRRVADKGGMSTQVQFFQVQSLDGVLTMEMAVGISPVLIIGFGRASAQIARLRMAVADFAGPCTSMRLSTQAFVTTRFGQDYDAFNLSSGSGYFAWADQALIANETLSTLVGNSDPQVVQVPSGGFSYLPLTGFTVSQIFYDFANVTKSEMPLRWSAEIGYNVDAREIVGVSILQLALFLGPRLFLFATGAQRCQQLLQLPKMVASVYPPMVKNKVIVSVILACFPVILAMFHLGVGDPISGLQVFQWIVEIGAWLFSTWVLFLEHSRAMPQTWIPLRTWWVLAFYAESMSLYTKLSTVADLDIMFFPYLLQYVCYISMLLLALLHTSSSFEYSQLLRGGQVKRVGKQDKGAVFVAVTLAMFTGQLVYGLAVLILPNYAQNHGITKSELGLVVGCYAIAVLTTSPFFGYLSKVYGRRNMLLGGLSGLSISTVMFAFSDSLWSLMLARIFQGFAASANFTAGQAVLADTFPQERLGVVLGAAAGWSGLGLLLGPPLGGFLYDLGGYTLPFLIGAALSFVDVLVVALLMEDMKFEDRPTKLEMLWKTRVPIITGVIVFGSSTLTMMEPTLPLFIQQKFKVNLSTVGVLMGAGVMMYGLGSPLSGWLSDRFGRTRIMSIGLILLGISLPFLTAPSTIVGEGFALGFLGISAAFAVVATLPELAQEVHMLGSNSYEEVYSIFNAAYAMGNIVGPVCGLFMIDQIGITPTYTLFGIIVALYVIPLNMWKHKASDLGLMVSAHPESGSLTRTESIESSGASVASGGSGRKTKTSKPKSSKKKKTRQEEEEAMERQSLIGGEEGMLMA